MVEIEGEPWFVLADIGDLLDLKQHAKSGFGNHLYRLGSDEHRTLSQDLIPQAEWWANFPRKARRVLAVSESGLYKLLTRSDKPVSRPFQDWVTREVLPSIRKTGGYKLEPCETMPLPASIAQAFKDGYARAKGGPTRRGDRIKRVTLRLILPWRL